MRAPSQTMSMNCRYGSYSHAARRQSSRSESQLLRVTWSQRITGHDQYRETDCAMATAHCPSRVTACGETQRIQCNAARYGELYTCLVCGAPKTSHPRRQALSATCPARNPCQISRIVFPTRAVHSIPSTFKGRARRS